MAVAFDHFDETVLAETVGVVLLECCQDGDGNPEMRTPASAAAGLAAEHLVATGTLLQSRESLRLLHGWAFQGRVSP